jgi:hypothetical protein
MAKSEKRIDPNQLNIFDLLLSSTYGPACPGGAPASKLAGSFDVDRQFREIISAVLKNCPLSRYQVAARMSELLGQEITKAMLDSWTAESKEGHRFPAIFLPAFCEAVGQADPIRLLGRLVGVFVLPGPEALRAEIHRITEEISQKQQEKKKKDYFFKRNREVGEEVG